MASEGVSSLRQAAEVMTRSWRELPPKAQQHVRRVYTTLFGALGSATAGAFARAHYGFSSPIVNLATVFLVAYINMTRDGNASKGGFRSSARLWALMGAGFCMGVSIGDVLHASASVNPAIPFKAVCGTALSFASFSLAALVAKRRSLLYIGGVSGSILNALFMLRLARLFGMRGGHEAEIVAGLIAFSGYIVFNTQLMVERAASSVADATKDALDLLIDFAAVLVRLCLALMRRDSRQSSRRDRDRRNVRAHLQ